MANAVVEAVEKLNNAVDTLNNLMRVLHVDAARWNDKRRVQVYTLRDLQQVPGELSVESFQADGWPPQEKLFKTVGGVEFYCLVDREGVSL